MYVTPVKAGDLDRTMCSAKFLTHIELFPDRLVYVKCDKQGNLDLRTRSGDKKEYRLFDVSKHEKAEHVLTLKANQSLLEIL